MKKPVSLALSAAVASIAFAAPAANATNGGTTEGCTPGYWKVQQHHDSWQEAGPGDKLRSKFAKATLYKSTKNMTLLQALQGGGGGGLDGAAKILARAAVAAYLNASYDDGAGHLAFPWRRYEPSEFDRPALVKSVNAAFASKNRGTMLELASRLDRDNNLGCPLT
ncbi:hypothetical protein [Nocardioides caldifontis]|uniref:hypothetical protein n=1 Tax=Nocardioides caldifontis TaxID=2588938 RepID=UPI0011E04880|nr:hypothetical protein [Nocardioides caldifontis]